LKGSDAILIEDGFSLDDYFLVGVRGTSSIQYPSIVYIPYGLMFIEVTDYKTLHQGLGIVQRAILTNNGLDTTGEGNAESLQVCAVDMTGLPNQSLR
jgi:hypothetical protein